MPPGGGGGRGHRWVVWPLLAEPGPKGMREVLEKDSGQVGWCSQLGGSFGEVAVDAETGRGGVGDPGRPCRELTSKCHALPGTGGTLPWPGRALPRGVVLAVRWGALGVLTEAQRGSHGGGLCLERA